MYVTCRCGAILDTEVKEREVKNFSFPEGTLEIFSEAERHHCPTFNFTGRTSKETKNNFPRLG